MEVLDVVIGWMGWAIISLAESKVTISSIGLD
jgi:hypothetical protein